MAIFSALFAHCGTCFGFGNQNQLVAGPKIVTCLPSVSNLRFYRIRSGLVFWAAAH